MFCKSQLLLEQLSLLTSRVCLKPLSRLYPPLMNSSLCSALEQLLYGVLTNSTFLLQLVALWSLTSHACKTPHIAEQNLAKKSILLLQSLYNFKIKDVNYYKSIQAQTQYLLQRESYMAAKKRRDDLYVLREFPAISTPSGSGHQIPPLTEPPLLPPRKRTCVRDGSPSSIAPSTALVDVYQRCVESGDKFQAFLASDAHDLRP